MCECVYAYMCIHTHTHMHYKSFANVLQGESCVCAPVHICTLVQCAFTLFFPLFCSNSSAEGLFWRSSCLFKLSWKMSQLRKKNSVELQSKNKSKKEMSRFLLPGCIFANWKAAPQIDLLRKYVDFIVRELLHRRQSRPHLYLDPLLIWVNNSDWDDSLRPRNVKAWKIDGAQ